MIRIFLLQPVNWWLPVQKASAAVSPLRLGTSSPLSADLWPHCKPTLNISSLVGVDVTVGTEWDGKRSSFDPRGGRSVSRRHGGRETPQEVKRGPPWGGWGGYLYRRRGVWASRGALQEQADACRVILALQAERRVGVNTWREDRLMRLWLKKREGGRKLDRCCFIHLKLFRSQTRWPDLTLGAVLKHFGTHLLKRDFRF